MKMLGDVVREGDWLHTGDLFIGIGTGKGIGRPPAPRIVKIERIVYNDDLTRSFVLAPNDSFNSKLYRTLTSEATLRRTYRRLHTNEIRIQ